VSAVLLLHHGREPRVRAQAPGRHEARGTGAAQGTDLCAREPERAARLITDRGFVDRYDYALQTMREVPYDRWRQQDPADTIRFYALRLRERGMIKASPQKILAQGTDWRFLNELKKELKG
jgi:NitT/TauT family transport system substrate-binding protein